MASMSEWHSGLEKLLSLSKIKIDVANIRITSGMLNIVGASLSKEINYE